MKIWIMNHYAIDHFVNKGGRHFWIGEQLAKDGYEVTVFGCNEKHNSIGSYFEDELWTEHEAPAGEKFVAIRSSQYMGNGISRVKNMVGFAKNLLKVAGEYAKINGKPNIIYASSVHPLTVLAGEKLAHRWNVPCIGEVRDLWPETLVAYGAIKKKSLVAKLLYSGEKYMYRRADAMVFTMEGAPDYIREHKWDKENGGPIDISKVYNINNGVDIEQFDKNKCEYVIPDEHLDNPDLFCAVYTGAIKRANNLGILLAASEKLKDIDNLRILVWGEGNEIEELKSKANAIGLAERFIFKGNVEKKYIPSIISRSKLNLMHWERTSVNNYGYDYNKLFEYLAAGVVIFSTIQSGHSLLINKNCGIETSGQTVEDIAEGIRNIYYMSEDERNEWGKRARIAAGDYDFKVQTKTMEKIIIELLEENNKK